MKSNDDISNARYYANAAEQQILIQGLQRYFSLPERSQNRNKITKEVSQFLQCFSPHWSHRAVRLWFNNNKHSYFNGQSFNTEIANNPTTNLPIINNLAQNNLNMKINQPHESLAQNNANIPLNNPSLINIPILQIPNTQPIIIPGMQYQNFNQIPENRGMNNIKGQESALPTNFNAVNPMMQNQFLNQIPPIEQPKPAPKMQQQQIAKQQYIVPQIAKTVNPVLPPSQTKTVNTVLQPPAPLPNQPSNPPLEVKISPKAIPQPQIQSSPNSSVNSSSSLPPSHFHPIPTPQIDSKSYIELPKKTETKKKVTVMPPIQISAPAKTSSGSSSFSESKSTPSLGQSFSYWGSSNEGGSFLEFGMTKEKMSKQITALLAEIRETPEEPLDDSSLLKMKINEFERMCNDFRTRFGFLSPQIIDPSFKFTRFPIHDIVREISGSLSSLSLSLSPSTGIDGYGGYMGGFMYMGSLGSLGAFGRSDSNFSLNTFSPSTSMNLINDTTATSSIHTSMNDQSEDGVEEKNRSFTYSSSPSFTPSTSSSMDASMTASQNIPSSANQSTEKEEIESSMMSSLNEADSCFLDQISHSSIWQARSFKSTHIPYFECASISRGLGIAAYAYKHIDFSSNEHQRAICFTSRLNSSVKSADEYEDSADAMHESWKTVLVDSHSVIESMIVDDNSAWLLTNREIIHSSLFEINSSTSSKNDFCASNRIELPQGGGSSSISFIGNSNDAESYGVVASFSSSSDLLFINSNNDQELQKSQTSCDGISCVAALSNDMIACGVPLKGTVTLVNKDGNEIRSFVGHCGAVLGIYPLYVSNDEFETNLFASRADDNTIRVWDVRERIPLFQITTSLTMTSNSNSSSMNSQSSSVANATSLGKSGSNQQMSYCSFLNVDGNDQYLMFGLPHQIGVIDIRKDFAKPLLGVTTDDYDPISLCYNQETNNVAIFGEVENIASRDSMLFVGNDGQSRKRIFRTYNSFIG